MSFELLEHTADVRILAKGESKEKLFLAALEGLCEVILPGSSKSNENQIKIEVEVSSFDASSQIIDFLAEALYYMYEQNIILNKANFDDLDENYLKCILSGYKVDEFHEDVKAVTYHEAEIKEENEVFSSIIVLDL